MQDRDQKRINPKQFQIVTERQPTEKEMRSMIFGWRVVRHVKSNAIVYSGDERTLGVGAGQMARVDSSQVAVWKAGEAKLSLQGSAIASDAFFPFADGLLAAADAGATAAIQPGGSVRDEEVIAAANDRDMAMVFTNVRHFKH
jgi:phosphoribosylaminoimidazolecarboxamide formyltransferase/IMP cyclohydrolase